MRLLLIIAALSSVPASAADPARGREAFQVCAACHSGAPEAIGPSLKGVVGRAAGSVPGFRYSGPMTRSGIRWTPDKLRAFVTSPQSVVPGNRMPFSGTSPETAADIVAYLSASR